MGEDGGEVCGGVCGCGGQPIKEKRAVKMQNKVQGAENPEV